MQPSGRYWRSPKPWAWAGMLVVQLAVAACLSAYTYFFVDDFLFMRQAQTMALTIHFLRLALFEHFSPLSRVVDWFLVHVSIGNFTLAHSIQLLIYAFAVAAFALMATTILKNSWKAFVLTAFFGESLFLMRMLRWWTAELNTLPATAFGLIMLTGFIRWRRDGSKVWLSISILSFGCALADYEDALYLPVYALLISMLVLEDRLSIRTWVKSIWQDKFVWLVLGVMDAAALYNYLKFYYAKLPRPSVGDLLHFLSNALTQNFIPAMVGVKYPESALSSNVLVMGGILTAAAIGTAVTLLLRPKTWRLLAIFAVVFLLTMIPVGISRLVLFGQAIASELDYQQNLQFMFMVLLTFALSAGFAGNAGHFRLLRVLVHWPLSGKRPVIAGLTGIALAGGYMALFVPSANAMSAASWEPHQAKTYIATFQSGVQQVVTQTGTQPNLLDLNVPSGIMPTAFAPFNSYGELLPTIDPEINIGRTDLPVYVLRDSGALVPAHFNPVSTLSGLGGVASGPMCVAAGETNIRLTPVVPVNTFAQPSGLPYAIKFQFSVPSAETASIAVSDGVNLQFADGNNHTWTPGNRGEYVVITPYMQVQEVDVSLPQGGCVTAASVGPFTF